MIESLFTYIISHMSYLICQAFLFTSQKRLTNPIIDSSPIHIDPSHNEISIVHVDFLILTFVQMF